MPENFTNLKKETDSQNRKQGNIQEEGTYLKGRAISESTLRASAPADPHKDIIKI